MALAIEQANAQKITIGGKPVTFKMVSEDDQADPKVGTTVAQKLVDAKVVAVVGHFNSGVSIPASEIYSKAGIPLISGSSTNPTLTEHGLKTMFRIVGRDDQQGPAIAAYIADELKGKKVAIIDDKTAYGEGLADEVEKTAQGRQGATSSPASTPPTRTPTSRRSSPRSRAEPGRHLLRRHRRHRRPDAQADARARHQGGIRVRRRRMHRRDFASSPAPPPTAWCARRPGLPARSRAARSSRTLHQAKFGEIKQYAPIGLRRAPWRSSRR